MRGIAVLLIDDDWLTARSVRRAVGGCTIAASVAEGIQLAVEEQPNVIVLDVYFGGDPSFDMIPKLRAAAPHAEIVMITGYPNSTDCERSRQAGARAYIDKVDFVYLRSVIKAVSSLACRAA